MKARLHALPGWVVVGGLIALSTLLRTWAGLRVHSPWIVPDEVIYGKLGQSLWSSGSFEILGERQRYYSLLYPALVGAPLSLGDLRLGYDLLKPLQALVMSLAAVPVYLWARSLASKWWALTAAALALCIPGLAYTGLIMTEVLFYPLVAVAAWRMAAALETPSRRNQALLLVAILAACATRLQGVVLAPAFVTAILLVCVFERSWRRALPYWHTLVAFVAAAGAWAAWRLSSGGPASELFGAYRVAGEVSYSVEETIRYARWHLADVLLVTGIVPVCAVAILLVGALRGREESPRVRAYAAVATAVTAWVVVQVGLFASVHVGRLAERDLLSLAPVLFVGLAAWLSRGAPRPRLVAPAVALAALGLVLWLPVGRLVSPAAIPDAFMVIPLERLQRHSPGADLQLIVDLGAAAVVVALIGVPRRLRWALPAGIAIVLAAISVHASRVVAAEATLVQRSTVGDDPRWIDRTARGDVAYLYTGEVLWNSVWESLFWNRKLTRVYSLLNARVPHLSEFQQPSVGPLPDGRLVMKRFVQAEADNVVASGILGFRGEQQAYAFAPGVVLWRLRPPFRLATWVQQASHDGGIARMLVLVYGCGPGELTFRTISPVDQRILLRSNGVQVGRPAVRAGQAVTLRIPTRPKPPPGTRICRLAVDPETPAAFDQVRLAGG